MDTASSLEWVVMMIIIYTTEKGQCTGKTPTRARLNENNILKLASYVTSAKQKKETNAKQK